MKKRTKEEDILKVAEQLFETNQSVSVRSIADKAGVADGLLTHHFGSYAGLVAVLTSLLNKRQAEELENFDGPRGRSQLDIAVMYFRELAKLDLNPKNSRLRRMSCGMSWQWKPEDEDKLAPSVMSLLQPLKKLLKFERDVEPDDVLMTLQAIYLQALRLAFNNSLLAASVVKTEENQVAAVVQHIKPKFALILDSK